MVLTEKTKELYCYKKLNDFIKTLSKTNIDLDLFYYNLQTLEFNYAENNNLDGPGIANYETISNKINFTSKAVLGDHLYHELFHCASSIIQDDYIFSGFQETNTDSNKILGISINEGFTEFLTHTYFGDSNAYPLEVFYAEKLSQLVGFEKIQKYYFDADIETLIDDLLEYDTEDNVVDFFTKLDTYTLSEVDVLEQTISDKELQKIISECSDKLLSWYYQKINNEKLDENLITAYAQDFFDIYLYSRNEEEILDLQPTDEGLEKVKLKKWMEN